MLNIFWKPCFNNSWIYLSDEIILNYLSEDNGSSAIANFYKRILIKLPYQENIDYKQVSYDNEIVKFGLTFSLSKNSKSKHAHNKKYYIISGETFKCLLLTSRTNKGNEMRLYYIKIEILARNMKDYLFAFLNKEKEKLTLNNMFLINESKKK